MFKEPARVACTFMASGEMNFYLSDPLSIYNSYISRYDSLLHLYYKKFRMFVYNHLLSCHYYFANGLTTNQWTGI